MMVVAGSTAHFTVSYDDSLASGASLAAAVLAECESDLSAISGYFGGIMPNAATLPFQIALVPGAGGASHPGCLATAITCFINANSDTLGVPAVVAAEVVEVFEATQNRGLNCGYSNGEALSRVLPGVLHPNLRNRFSTGNSWLNTTGPCRPDWVTTTDTTDTNFVSIGCGSLFFYYLADQLNFSWNAIIAAAAPTLAQTAQNLGLPNAFADFTALLQRHFPCGTPVSLPDDDPFPLDDPSLYLRHNLADDGTSHTGSLADSPDIIVKNSPVTNPQATFSTPASIGSDHESDPNVLDGQDNFLYLRVWNRGTKDALNATATIYWSPPATLVTPSMWNRIGSSTFADVPKGRVVQVSDPGITWPQASIPGPGHYCFVATVGSADDPAPSPTGFATFDDYVAYIYAHNNITWRNFNVTSAVQHGARFMALRFLVTGAWDRARGFELETIARLPAQGRLALEVPRWLGEQFSPARPSAWRENGDDDDDSSDRHPDGGRGLRVPLHAVGTTELGSVELPQGARVPSRLLLVVPEAAGAPPAEVAIRQLYGGREVGRITWRLVPGERDEQQA